ncbi:MAG TPA: hypothetical protein V6D07_10560 [Trichocoleus sp.]
MLIPGASSSVAIAAAQVVKHYGGIAVGTTPRADKQAKLQAMSEAPYDHLLVTQDNDWYREAKKITGGKGFNVKGLVQPWLNLVQGNKALNRQQNGSTPKNQLAPVGFAANGNPNGALHVFGMNFVIGAIDLTSRF